ncbi:MAG: hypothetical protein FJW31_12605 [Acidobacteria bacterium]|nr:hypothetical protein [Acidobacteriota bacterium]
MFRLSTLSFRKRAALVLSGVLLATLGTGILFRAIPAGAATSGPKPTATYSRGVLSLSVPYTASHAGAGTLTLELLDPEDAVLGRAQAAARVAAPGDGVWSDRQVRLTKPLPVDELVWHRLRHRFTFDGAAAPEIPGIESISNMLHSPVLHVLAQQSYAAGSTASVRLIAVDSRSGAPLTGPVHARAEFGERRQLLFAGKLNERGTASVPLRFPAGVTGAHTLRYVIDSPLGETKVAQPVRLEAKASILLTTEKPLYQPGQTIHVRALVLDRASRHAAATRPITFELEDPRGNKVFRKAAQTSSFGVASAEFTLADEVNLGAYCLRAAMDGAAAERTLNVERYVLPKFKVAVEFTGKHQHSYRPGDTVTGIVRAHYFFGQPVDGSVTVKASRLDVARFEAATVQVKTGPQGDYRFALKLPTYFAGKPLSGGAARVLIEATVKDSASHGETRGMPVTVSESPLLITAVPEGGRMAPGMDNEVYVPASYAGGVVGGIMGAIAVAAPAPRLAMLAPEALAMDRQAPLKEEKAKSSASSPSASEPGARVRSYFPEALYINPEIVTAGNGEASVVIPIADSITTWRMAMMASTTRGALGSGSSSLKVFQEFFADLDLPVTLTQGDRVSIPVAAYNYAGAADDVALRLEPADWFSLADGDTADKHVAVENGCVGGAQFTLEARRIGKFQLKLAAKLVGTKFSDIVVREIEVVQNGREQNLVVNGRLEPAAPAIHDVTFPAHSIPEASKIYVRLYPGPLSQVVDGMDAILRMPYGCFEQTSSATYPNVLALEYLKRSKKLTPQVRAKAEGFIVNGYQRLLTYEVPGGGFSWFGNPPANKILTSYGLMEFFDMAKVHDVDPRLIERTQAWLAAQQKPDGSWAPDKQFINEGATNRYNTNVTRITAYVA